MTFITQYNARRAIGTLGNNFGTAYALGGGREAIYLMTGQPKADGAPHTIESAITRANTIGAAAGITGGLKDMLQSLALRLR
ncbi:MAG: hypothetical protein K2W95_34600 [Candidatus Obscuribacterales bacterium]|nr:hypothetical protein [Candidatus Obscuribacterales bacterium]